MTIKYSQSHNLSASRKRKIDDSSAILNSFTFKPSPPPIKRGGSDTTHSAIPIYFPASVNRKNSRNIFSNVFGRKASINLVNLKTNETYGSGSLLSLEINRSQSLAPANKKQKTLLEAAKKTLTLKGKTDFFSKSRPSIKRSAGKKSQRSPKKPVPCRESFKFKDTIERVTSEDFQFVNRETSEAMVSCVNLSQMSSNAQKLPGKPNSRKFSSLFHRPGKNVSKNSPDRKHSQQPATKRVKQNVAKMSSTTFANKKTKDSKANFLSLLQRYLPGYSRDDKKEEGSQNKTLKQDSKYDIGLGKKFDKFQLLPEEKTLESTIESESGENLEPLEPKPQIIQASSTQKFRVEKPIPCSLSRIHTRLGWVIFSFQTV